MDEQFPPATGGVPTAPFDSHTAIPRDVQGSFLLWLSALGLGVAETVLAIISNDIGTSQIIMALALRTLVTAVLTAIIVQLLQGKNWARILVAILLGGIGTLSLVYDPVDWLLAGNSVRALLQTADSWFWVFALVRLAHVAAVLSALVLMFRPRANAYFRADGRRQAPLKDSALNLEL